MEYPTFKDEFHLPGIKLLPHRDPFLFVDELISADEMGALGKYTYTDAKTAIPGKSPPVDIAFASPARSGTKLCLRLRLASR